MARIKTQHRKRQGLHKQGIYQRRHIISLKSPIQRKRLCGQSHLQNICFQGNIKHSVKSKRFKGQHGNHTGDCFKTDIRFAAELPQTGIQHKRTDRKLNCQNACRFLIIQIV